MSQNAVGFTDERARSYDDRVRKHIPGYEVLHLLADTLLARELPEEASILAVGAGTGHEVLESAARHPRWRFVGTDTASTMLTLADEKAKAAGLSERARWHAGPVETLTDTGFDAATLHLVLHFVPDAEKGTMLSAIAKRLKPGAPFLVANLFGDPNTASFRSLNEGRKAWAVMKGLDPEMAAQFCDPTRSDMHIIPEEKLTSLLHTAGFTTIQRVYQSLTVGMWFSRAAR